MTENFSITIKDSEKEITVTGNETFINKWYLKLKEEILKQSDHKGAPSKNNSSSTDSSTNARMSLPEMLRGSNAKTMSDTIMLFVFFMEKHESMNVINTADISKAFGKAKKVAPKNITNQVNQLVSQGFLYEEPEKKNNLKSVTLTDSGLKHVKEKLIAKK